MPRQLSDLIGDADVHYFQMFLYEQSREPNRYLLNNDILLGFEAFCRDLNQEGLLTGRNGAYRLLRHTPEMMVLGEDQVVLLHRYKPSKYRVYRINVHTGEYEDVAIPELLDLRERFADTEPEPVSKLRLDFLPFYDYGPSIKDSRRIGNGIDFLNRYMSSSLFQKPAEWQGFLFNFLKIHHLGEQQLLINGQMIRDRQELVERLETVLSETDGIREEAPHTDIALQLQREGFEPGWGDTVGRVRETMQLLLDLFEAPDDSNLRAFITRIPMISKIAILSPHGWFGQENVLGRPDTGGQIVYILDQVRALERTLTDRLRSYGLEITPRILIVTRLIPENDGTTSNMRLEKIHHSENAHILRVPFRDERGNVHPHWISRFQVWPYLERFAEDVGRELLSELNGRPDLIIGNYSDGNLVATLLSEKLNVIQCNIAHALEKTKYLFSDLHWKNFESDYNFSLQFVVDLIAMNMADFIITSTAQEISGSAEGGGQYESYQFFTMPDLMQVVNGINIFHPKFNVIPPGADETVYFPHSETERRLENQTTWLSEQLFIADSPDTVGKLENPDKPPIFTMARLDRIKNITGLVESFGRSPRLQELANLVVIAGKVDAGQTTDAEEIQEIERMYALIEEYGLHGKIRWLGRHLSKEDSGEVYRIIADRRGVFVQPARFEGFGLTVLEAMSSGLPTFATRFGGPSEIIVDGQSGFLVNPTVAELLSDPLVAFFEAAVADQAHWTRFSEAAIARVQERFTWRLYSEKLLNLTALYGFWRYAVSQEGKVELSNYCHLLFQLLFKRRAEELA